MNEGNLYTIGEVTYYFLQNAELTSMLDPLLYRWGVPPVVIRCVHWTMQMWVLQTWITAQGPAIVMDYSYISQGPISWSHCGLVTPYGDIDRVNIGSGNGLLTGGTKPLPLPTRDIYLRIISREIPQQSITKISLNISCVKFHSNFPGANELIPFPFPVYRAHGQGLFNTSTSGRTSQNTRQNM